MKLSPNSGWIVACVLASAFGVSTTIQMQATSAYTEAQGKIKKLEADLRTAHGKIYDMQENRNEELESCESSKSFALWEVQNKLNQCILANAKEKK